MYLRAVGTNAPTPLWRTGPTPFSNLWTSSGTSYHFFSRVQFPPQQLNNGQVNVSSDLFLPLRLTSCFSSWTGTLLLSVSALVWVTVSGVRVPPPLPNKSIKTT